MRTTSLAITVAQVMVVALCASLLTVALQRNDGTFSYSLDDPYIHLAFSEQLAQGHFGLHPKAVVAPSSSVLWPWLLVPGAGHPWHDVLPLALNGLALLWILSLLRQLLQRAGFISASTDGRRHNVLAAALIVLLSALLNLPFLVSTGMEHTLQVALALAVLRGLIDTESRPNAGHRRRLAGPLLIAALTLGPLVRYEFLAVSCAAVLFLLLRRRFLLAGLGLLGATLPLAAFSWCLLDMGLPPLPSSMLAKSGWLPTAESASWGAMVDAFVVENLGQLAQQPAARRLATLLGALWATALWQRRRESTSSGARKASNVTLAVCVSLALLAHLLVGRFAATERYGIYLIAFGGMALLHLLAPTLQRLQGRHGSLSVAAGLLCILVPWQADTLQILLQTPQASHNIYQQQYQMHRFVTEYYHQPIAVNDLGWVSFRNPHFVLDLWGIGDETNRRARLSRDPSWPQRQVETHGIGAALVYDRWFRERLPDSWRPVAYLRLVGQRITPGDSVVTFYATRDDSYRGVLKAVRRLRATLPPDTQMRLAYRQTPQKQ